jgi:GH25 family lysozyme M1 (1,4-beta-N-acetylmuramidase)
MANPILIPDRYWQDGGNDWKTLGASTTFNGAILKATEGVSLPKCEEWFIDNWGAVMAGAAGRYGGDFFRGAYHYLEFFDDGAKQATHYLDIVDSAGGWQAGDFWPIVDVERGSATARNFAADAERIRTCVTAFVSTLRARMGADTPVLLYAGGVFRDLDVQLSDLCTYLWAAKYERSVGSYEQYGWPDDKVVLWQYTDGVHNDTGYPSKAPGLGATDLSAYRGADIDALRTALVRGA